MAVTVLNPILGYDKVAQISRKALSEGIGTRAAALALGFLSGEDYDRLVDPLRMATGHRAQI